MKLLGFRDPEKDNFHAQLFGAKLFNLFLERRQTEKDCWLIYFPDRLKFRTKKMKERVSKT
jgi:hypothetical protein